MAACDIEAAMQLTARKGIEGTSHHDSGHGRYLEKFVGDKSVQQELNLQERTLEFEWTRPVETCSCGSEGLVNPNLHTTLKTDTLSLCSPEHGEPAPDCAEIYEAVCVTYSVLPREDHILYPVKPLRGEFREGDTYASSGTQHWGRRGELTPEDDGPGPLRVPIEFADIGYDWKTSSSTPLTQWQKDKLQRCMKPFLRACMAGIIVELQLDAGEVHGVASEGRVLPATITLAGDLADFKLKACGVQRTIPLATMRAVRPPEPTLLAAKDGASCAEAQKTAREELTLLAEIRLVNGRFLRLRFGHRDQAAFFGTCARLLVRAVCAGAPKGGKV